jgi:hypothetical protein
LRDIGFIKKEYDREPTKKRKKEPQQAYFSLKEENYYNLKTPPFPRKIAFKEAMCLCA